MMDIVFVSSTDGDWEGLYINGKLKDQGHTLDAKAVAEKIMHAVHLSHSIKSGETDSTKLNLFGFLPDNLSEIEVNYNA